MDKYKLDFDVWKESPGNWGEREAKHLANVISQCRLGRKMKFNKFGTFSWEEEDKIKKYHPIVEEQESYSKKNSNCLIFDLTIPNCEYDKVFVYQYKTGIKGSSGYYIYSSKDPSNHIHKYYLANDMNQLILSLNRTTYDLDIKYNSKEINITPYRYHDRWA